MGEVLFYFVCRRGKAKIKLKIVVDIVGRYVLNANGVEQEDRGGDQR